MQDEIMLVLEDQTLPPKQNDGLNLPGNNANSINSKICNFCMGETIINIK